MTDLNNIAAIVELVRLEKLFGEFKVPYSPAVEDAEFWIKHARRWIEEEHFGNAWSCLGRVRKALKTMKRIKLGDHA